MPGQWQFALEGRLGPVLQLNSCGALGPLGLGSLPVGRGSQQSSLASSLLRGWLVLSWLHASPQPLCIPYP